MLLESEKRIALISVHGDPAVDIGKEEAGGQNVYVRQVGEALARQGWKVDMFTRRSRPDQEFIIHHKPFQCRTIRLSAGPPEFIGRDHLFTHLPEFVDQFVQFQQSEGIDYHIVHTNYWLSSWVGLQLKERLGVVQVHTYHSLGAVKYGTTGNIPSIGLTRLMVEKLCLETADCIVATSPQEEQHLRSLVSKNGNTEVIPCGVDIKRFGSVNRDEARQQLGIDSKFKVVLYVGRFDKRKGIDTLVRAVASSSFRDKYLRLFIVGGSTPHQSDGDERDRIERLVIQLGLQAITTFPGQINEDLSAYYAAADVCVIPSHYEPFGLVAIESMACRTPVVASSVGGLKFTIQHEETGLLVPPKDSMAFSQAIDRILGSPSLRDQWGTTGRKSTEELFSWDRVALNLSELYHSLLLTTSLPTSSNGQFEGQEFSKDSVIQQ